jgi:Domain of Unknown Function (DUF748)
MNAGKPDSKNQPQRRRKILRWIAGLLLFYTVFGFLILPPIIRSVAVKQLAKQLDREVSIEKIKINPYALSTSIRGLLIKDKDGQPFVSWDEVYVNLQLASFFGHSWIFKEVSTTNTYVRVQMNKDSSLNFSDLIAKFSTNTPATPPPPSAPLALRIKRLHIARASASFTDLTPRTPFKRIIGPLDITLDNFRTDPDNKNPYSFSGTTDGGEKISWSGYFYLDPIRSQGELALENISLNKYAPLYQDFLRFQIRDGVVDLRSAYRFELNASNRVVIATNASLALHSFKLAEPDKEANIVELPEFSVTGVSVDAVARRGEIASISGSGAKLILLRDKNAAINIVELSKPADTTSQAPGGILLLLRSVTNAVAMLLNSTNAWSGAIREVNFQNGALSLTDLINSRPVTLNLDQISFTATNISNVPGTNLTATLALRWNTNGTVRTDVSASFLPPTADIDLALDKVELRQFGPYLESKLNLLIIDSKLGLNGHVSLRTPKDGLPQVTFTGDEWLNDLSTVDGVFGEELLKWGSVRISGIDANLNPPTVAIKEIAVDDAYARIIIETNRTINLLAALRMVDTNAPAETPKDESPKPRSSRGNEAQTEKAKSGSKSEPPHVVSYTNSLPKISIATLVVSNAQIRFTDRSMTPNVNLSIQQAGGTIAGLSSEQLQHADVNLHAKVDNVGPVEITGAINPFDERSTNEIKITVKDVDLTPASAYSRKFAGYRIAKGKLNLALAYHLQGRNLKSENLITLDQFTFGEKVDSPDATKLPVRLGVAILKDRNGKITLDVPVEGSLDDPKFKLNKVIVMAIENILVKIVTSPFAVLGALFGGKGEELNYQEFAPGSFELQAAGTNKLDSLVKGLYERPGLQLEIAGSIDPNADRDGVRRVALEKQLRTAKWQFLRKSERTTTTPEQISLTPDERTRFLQKLYDEASSKEPVPPPITNAPATNQTAAPAIAITKKQTRTVGTTKGATMLMQHKAAPPTALLATATTASSTNAPATGSQSTEVIGEIEQALLNSIAISDSDFETLASDRAKAVRDYILQTGKVEAERIFINESQPGGVKTNGSKVFLQLR